MTRRATLAALCAFFPGLLPPAAIAADQAGLDTQARTAIDNAVAYLETMQRPEGRWVSTTLESTYPNATTALTAYTLLQAGKPPGYWRIERVAEAFRNRDKTRTAFARACTLLMWQALGANEHRREAEDDLRFLTWQQDERGGWGEPDAEKPDDEARLVEPVASYLALKATARTLRETGTTNLQVFNREENAAAAARSPGGGWHGMSAASAEEKPGPANAAATAARLATLPVVYDAKYLHTALRFNGRFMARCGEPSTDSAALISAIESGWQWVDGHWPDLSKPTDTADDGTPIPSRTFALYALSEAAAGFGRSHIAGKPWRHAIAGAILAMQQADGSWGTVHDTCFAILALVNCRRPVDFTRLVTDDDHYWHRTPRALANLALWLGENGRRDTGWQAVPVDGNLDAVFLSPIAVWSGHALPELGSDARQKLGDYVRRGGTLLLMPCCQWDEFEEQSAAWVRTLLPHAEPVALDGQHPLWKIGNVPPIDGVDGFGDACRTWIVRVTFPAAAVWQQRLDKERKFGPYFDLGEGVAAYATFHRRTSGLEPFVSRPEPAPEPRPESSIALLKHRGDWAVKAAALDRAVELVNADQAICRVDEPVDAQRTRRRKLKALFSTGTRFDAPEGADAVELRAFLAAGGTILSAAACGSETYDRAFQDFAQDLPGEPWQRIPDDDPLITGSFAKDATTPLSEVSFGERFDTPPPPAPSTVILYGKKHKGRWNVIHCPYDLASGVLGEPCPTCVGYAPGDAVHIIRNMLLYAIVDHEAQEEPKTAPDREQPDTDD